MPSANSWLSTIAYWTVSKGCRLRVARIHDRWSFIQYLFRKSIHPVSQILNLHSYNLLATSCRLNSQSCRSKSYAQQVLQLQRSRQESVSYRRSPLIYCKGLPVYLWAEAVAGQPNLLSYTNNILRYCEISTFEYDNWYTSNLYIL